MSEKFKVKVNNSKEFDVTENDVSNLDAISTSNGNYHVLKDNTSFKATIQNGNFNKKVYAVKVNNNTYNVNIANGLDQLINEMGFSLSAAKHVNSIKAPMPGLILDINVEVGQNVNEDDNLLILEAMKMENIITSPREGIIKSISVEKGNAVEKNQLLIEFE